MGGCVALELLHALEGLVTLRALHDLPENNERFVLKLTLPSLWGSTWDV